MKDIFFFFFSKLSDGFFLQLSCNCVQPMQTITITILPPPHTYPHLLLPLFRGISTVKAVHFWASNKIMAKAITVYKFIHDLVDLQPREGTHWRTTRPCKMATGQTANTLHWSWRSALPFAGRICYVISASALPARFHALQRFVEACPRGPLDKLFFLSLLPHSSPPPSSAPHNTRHETKHVMWTQFNTVGLSITTYIFYPGPQCRTTLNVWQP